MTDPLDAVAWPLRTERLLIRRYLPGDVDAAWRYRRLPEVVDGITAAPATLEDFRSYATEHPRIDQTLVVQLIDAEEGPEGSSPVIGDLMLRIEDAWAQAEVAEQARGTQAELGWVFDPEYGGRGYATEAVRAVIGLCFDTLGLRRVHAGCLASNESSWRLMERIGMRREEYSRETALHRSGRWVDGMNYGLLASEWQAGSGRVTR